MPYILEELEVDRIDFVDEGANSAAFIELFKRKENKKPMEFSEILSKMKPEHAAVVQAELDTANENLAKANADLDAANTDLEKAKADLEQANADLEKANADLEKANADLDVLKAKDNCDCEGEADENGVCKSCGRSKKSASFDETEVLKSMPEGAREMFLKMRAQKEAAEEQVRKAAEKEIEDRAVAKAATLKALPVEQATLVDILKSCDTRVIDILDAAASAIEGTVLEEVGKAGKGKSEAFDKDSAWSEIEKAAEDIAKRDSVTKQRAISIAIKENPELYRKYLDGGKN